MATSYDPRISPVTFNSLQDVRNHQWVGNAWSDSAAFAAIDEFALNDKFPLADRAEAIRLAAKNGMGLDDEQSGYGVEDQTLINQLIESYDNL